MWEKSEPWDAAAVVMAVNLLNECGQYFGQERGCSVCAARALRSRQAKIGARPAGASQRHQRPSSLLRDKKGEDPRAVGGQRAGLGGRTKERA